MWNNDIRSLFLWLVWHKYIVNLCIYHPLPVCSGMANLVDALRPGDAYIRWWTGSLRQAIGRVDGDIYISSEVFWKLINICVNIQSTTPYIYICTEILHNSATRRILAYRAMFSFVTKLVHIELISFDISLPTYYLMQQTDEMHDVMNGCILQIMNDTNIQLSYYQRWTWTWSPFTLCLYHDDVTKWKHFPRHWP